MNPPKKTISMTTHQPKGDPMTINHKTQSYVTSHVLYALAVLILPLCCALHAEKNDSLDMMSIAFKQPTLAAGNLGVVTPVMKNNKTTGFKFEFEKSDDYPSLVLPTRPGGWDLTPFVAIVVEIENVGNETILPALGIGNMGAPGDNQSGVNLVPGQTGFIRLEFGYSWGKESQKLDLKSIDRVIVFIGPGKKGAFVVKSICAVKS
jgi:hypothetical protein